jgi:cysteine desulfurase
VVVSSGSACSAGHTGGKVKILEAMGFNDQRARGLPRVTLGRFNTDEEVERFPEILPRAVATLTPRESAVPLANWS